MYNLKEIREKKGVTQEELSRVSNVSRTIISGLESGSIKTTTTGTLYKLAKALDVKIGDFFSLYV